MCGICGEYNFSGTKEEAILRIKNMLSLLVHRGPEDEGIFLDDTTILGHRRLKIIDLTENAHQPMFSENGRYIIVYNGEIYNFLEIRAELINRGETFKSNSDTEVILKSFKIWGIDSLKKFNGMWAFALYDKVKKELIISRDRIGEKPIYFAKTRKGIIFASEIRPLLLHNDVSKEIDKKALMEQVAARYVIAPKTLFKSVKKVPPGHILKITPKRIELYPYYTLPLKKEILEISEEEAIDKFSFIFEKSIERRLISDVPIGILLSSGIDSASIVAVVSKKKNGPIKTYTIGFEGSQTIDERKGANIISDHYKTEHHDIILSSKTFFEKLDEVLKHQDDPTADLAILPLYFLCKEAKKDVKVLLSGQGADETLGGYHLDRVFRELIILNKAKNIPFIEIVAKLLGKFNRKRDYLTRFSQLKNISLNQLPAKIRYDLTMPLDEKIMNQIFIEKSLPPYDRTLDAFYEEIPTHRGPIDSILSTLIKGWLPDNLLNFSDKMSMANSVEIRCPYLDNELIEFLFSIPERFKVKSFKTKYLLKKWAEKNKVPRETINRRKRGFPVPWEEWVRKELHQKVKEKVLSTKWFNHFFKTEGIRKIFEEELKGKEHGILIFNFLLLSYWGENMGL